MDAWQFAIFFCKNVDYRFTCIRKLFCCYFVTAVYNKHGIYLLSMCLAHDNVEKKIEKIFSKLHIIYGIFTSMTSSANNCPSHMSDFIPAWILFHGIECISADHSNPVVRTKVQKREAPQLVMNLRSMVIK